MNPLDDFIPRFDFSERHGANFSAPASRIMNAVAAWRNQDDPLVCAAIRLHEMPARLFGHAPDSVSRPPASAETAQS
ncbi:hypothetical protein AA23498_1151 [Acetobacter nitrogenifigens DSM 23921 = NBRC 105050]|nr:hypothetical protein AA23498_1151 [Acetobacter nitrogenifigens DSM 23921 = NBRC 105050]